jgi:DNA repair exonuclease SbcCD nuclease subunit
MAAHVRILLLADTHLGFDLPLRPRIGRRRRGHDFLANYAAALAPALSGEIDVVVHAGDVFDRSSVVPSVAYQAFEPLRRIADGGVPVFIVPGNHERSRLPHLRFASHPLVHVFDRARTFIAEVRGLRIALAGFPYERRDVRTRFPALLEETGWRREPAGVRLLCIHHCVEGATVGPRGYTFTTAADVIRLGDVPAGFAAVFAGHVHRHEVLTADLRDRPLDAPVLYPGSIERTSLAEISETKGFMVVGVGERDGGPRVRWQFRELPARPMIRRDLEVDGAGEADVDSAVRALIDAAPRDAVLSIRMIAPLTEAQWRAISPARLRRIAPDTMNVEVLPVREDAFSSPVSPRASGGVPSNAQLTFSDLSRDLFTETVHAPSPVASPRGR